MLIWHCLLINKNGKNLHQRIWIFSIHKKSIQQIWEKILYTATKTGLDTAQTDSKKVVYKTVDAEGELIGKNWICWENCETKKKKDKMLNQVRQVL